MSLPPRVSPTKRRECQSFLVVTSLKIETWDDLEMPNYKEEREGHDFSKIQASAAYAVTMKYVTRHQIFEVLSEIEDPSVDVATLLLSKNYINELQASNLAKFANYDKEAIENSLSSARLRPITDQKLSSETQAEKLSRILKGRYTLSHEIARGGMGVVFQGTHNYLDKSVAIKTILESSTETLTRRFEREAIQLSKLRSPYIPAVFDYGSAENNGIPFLAMELIEGKTLRDWVLRQALETEFLSSETIANLFLKITEAIAVCHQNNLIHRDLKPENILVKDGLTPMVIDFGIVKSSPNESLDVIERRLTPLTDAGQLIGTPHYMAPEQIDGGEVSSAADIWALGCILFFMLTKENPFQGQSITEILTAVCFRTIPEPSDISKHVNVELDAICRRCMNRDPKKRPTAEELTIILNQSELLAINKGVKAYRRPNRLVTVFVAIPRLFFHISTLGIFHPNRSVERTVITILLILPIAFGALYFLTRTP